MTLQGMSILFFYSEKRQLANKCKVKFWGHPSAILVLLLNGFLEEFEAPK
jgi:hypothetical protein